MRLCSRISAFVFVLTAHVSLWDASVVHASEQKTSTVQEIAVTASMGALWIAPELFSDDLMREHSCPCRKDSVNAVDRPYAGRQINHVSKLSDGFLIGSLIAAPSVYIASVPNAGLGGALLQDGLTFAQVIAANGILNQTLKYSVQRPRPYVYGLEADDPQLDNHDAFLSFYSGHTSTMFAATFGMSSIFKRRLPHSHMHAYVLATGLALSSTVGVMRVSSGKHFPSDVVAGALIGSGFGYGIPAYKDAQTEVSLLLVPTARGPALSSTYKW